ncbi:bifunctional diguanylate cyclase/phosphodiesterase [Marinimicrobium sp. ARAG 43.8]|uniref:bifunctional diguanylate cyclase/phosphodiesterase n=1 Tax=Marinimicrobium sp. ARAG 43.8 TaxID=3418719 RepID=UPI003CEC8529
MLTFAVSFSLALLMVLAERSSYVRTHQLELASQTISHVHLLEAQLGHSLSPTYALASFVYLSDNVSANFERVASQLSHFYPELYSLSLSPNGVVRHVYPLEKNASVLGFNQFEDQTQGPEARQALLNRALTVAGPYRLVQGQEGIVGRYPVFNEETFWGFTNVTILLDNILETSRLYELDDRGFHYQLWRTPPSVSEPVWIAGNTKATLGQPVVQPINLPGNTWALIAAPKSGWVSPARQVSSIALALAVALLLAYLARLLVVLRWHKENLEREVAERTQEVTTSLERYRSLIAASNTGAWELFHQKKFVQCSPEYFSMLGRHLSDYPMDGTPNLDHVWLDLIHPGDQEDAIGCLHRYLSGGGEGMYENRYRMWHSDGYWVWILSRGQLLHDAEGTPKGVMVGTHIDITQQVEDREQLALAAQVFEQSSEGILVTDASQNIVMVNNAFTRITGYSEEEVLGKTPHWLASGRHDSHFYHQMWLDLREQGAWQGEVWNRRKDGEIYPQWLAICEVRDAEGTLTHYIGTVSDISQLKEDQAEIHRLAYYDPLTGLPNRSLLEERAALALKLANRSHDNLALLFLDLDNFKNINDSLGHKIGDQLLQAFAQRIQPLIREEDTFARPGGDEFVILLPATDANGAAHTAQKLLSLLNQPFNINNYELAITSSVGIALHPSDGETLSELYTNADIAMYRAKKKGRNTYSFFTPELQGHYMRIMQVENALRRAIEQNELVLHYQPQKELLNGNVVGLEVLLRWNHPELGPVSPCEFIPIAESSGLIINLGEWVLREATKQLRHWINSGIAPPKLAVNLSAAQFQRPNLVEVILRILHESGLPPEYLELELTESITMDDPERAVLMINRLYAEGVTLSIDDFGTGYSSLAYLKRFRISKLKIDQSFVRDISRNNDDRVIVSTIITLAHSLGLRCVAEGVETQEQLEFLARLGCHDIQGFYISKPMDAVATEAFLRRASETPG